MQRRFNLINSTFRKNEATDKTFDKSKISDMTTDYKLRTYTAGCYYLDEKYEEWTGLIAQNNVTNLHFQQCFDRERNVCAEHILRSHHVSVLTHDPLWRGILYTTKQSRL